MKVPKKTKELLEKIPLSLESLARTAIEAAHTWNECAKGLREQIDEMEVKDE